MTLKLFTHTFPASETQKKEKKNKKDYLIKLKGMFGWKMKNSATLEAFVV